MKNEEQLQQKYAEFQLLNEQTNQIQQKNNLIEQQILQLNTVVDNLEGFDKVKDNSDLLFGIGPGIHAKGILKEKDLLVNVGSNILIKKTIPETISLVKVQIKELEEALEETKREYSLCCVRLQELQNELDNTPESK